MDSNYTNLVKNILSAADKNFSMYYDRNMQPYLLKYPDYKTRLCTENGNLIKISRDKFERQYTSVRDFEVNHTDKMIIAYI